MDSERRRSPRVWVPVWVCLDGVDTELRLRNANLSATGIYFEYDKPVGDPGTVEWLVLSSADRASSLQIMASVVRAITTQASDGKEVEGVAFEFMPESDEAIAHLREFVHYVLALAADVARANARGPEAAAGIRAVHIESDWSVPVGTPIRMEIIARGVERTTRVEGKAARVTQSETGGYRIEVTGMRQVPGPLRRFSSVGIPQVQLKERLEGPTRRFTPALGIPFAKAPSVALESDKKENEALVDTALEGLLGTLLELREQPKPEARSHLAGELSRIRLPALLSMIDTDKMTGELLLLRGGERRTLFIRRGRVLDVEPSDDPAADLRQMLTWQEGDFAFTLKAVIRADRVAIATAELLSEHARSTDEGVRHGRRSVVPKP